MVISFFAPEPPRQPPAHSALADRLIDRIRKLVDGNHVSAGDVEERSRRSGDCSVSATIAWSFGHDAATRTVIGNGAISGAHYGYDRGAFDAAVNDLCRAAAADREVRVPFTQRVVVAEGGSLNWADQPQTIRDFGEISVHRRCGDCSGAGTASCRGCRGSGREECSGCNGSGKSLTSSQIGPRMSWDKRWNEMVPDYGPDSCFRCKGAGRTVCTACGGNGSARCDSCNGHGLFTDLTRITAFARPRWSVRTEGTVAAEPLEAHLQQAGAAQSAAQIAFTLADTRFDDGDSWLATYHGTASVVELTFELKGGTFALPAVGAEPYPLVRPPIFDTLFADEIDDLRRLQDKSGHARPRGAKARRLFAAYRKQPALDRALRAVAALQGMARERPESAVLAACDGFISAQSARQLGVGLLELLHKASPPYSLAAWFAVMLLPSATAFLLVVDGVGDSNGWASLLYVTVVILLLTWLAILVLSPLAWLLSKLISHLQRRRLPKAYRQKGRDWQPKKYAYQAAIIAVALGAIYGLAAREGWLPKLNEPSGRAMSEMNDMTQDARLRGYVG